MRSSVCSRLVYGVVGFGRWVRARRQGRAMAQASRWRFRQAVFVAGEIKSTGERTGGMNASGDRKHALLAGGATADFSGHYNLAAAV